MLAFVRTCGVCVVRRRPSSIYFFHAAGGSRSGGAWKQLPGKVIVRVAVAPSGFRVSAEGTHVKIYMLEKKYRKKYFFYFFCHGTVNILSPEKINIFIVEAGKQKIIFNAMKKKEKIIEEPIQRKKIMTIISMLF